METLLHDGRFAIRTLLRSPGFTAVAVLALALGIGANTAIFSVVNGVLLKSLSFPEPDRLVALSESSAKTPVMAVSFPTYLDWRARQGVFENLGARMPAGGVLTGNGEPERVIGRWVTASFFQTLKVSPQVGRFFDEAEDAPGADRTMVISYGLWQRRFGGDPDLIGKSIFFNSEAWTVIGVTPKGFDYYGQTNISNDFFIPIAHLTDQPYMSDRNSHTVFVIGRLKPGVTIEQARVEMNMISAQLENEYPASNTGNTAALVSFLDDYVGDSRQALLVISAVAAFVLLIACANVANLLLARAASRQKEIALRIALGAGRWRVVRQLLTESLILSALGGALGLLIAVWGVELLLKLNPDALPRVEDIKVDPGALGFTFLVTIFTGILFGLVPAIQTSKVDLNEALKEGGRQASGGRGARRMRGALVIGEVAISLMLMIGAGLLVKSFGELMRVDPGFDPRNVLTLRLRLPDVKYREAWQTTGFLKEVKRRVAALPGVRQVSLSTGFPFRLFGSGTGYLMEGQPEPQKPGDQPSAVTQSVSEEYHSTLGIALLTGRYFTDRDTEDSRLVAIVDEGFVRRHFEGQPLDSALGKRLRFAGKDEPWREIVGVVRPVHQGFEDVGPPGIYRPWLQITPRWLADNTRAMDLVVKTDSAPETFVAAIKHEVQAIDPDEPLGNVQTLASVVDESIAPRRFSLFVVTLFAFIALMLGAVGLYGVMSYAVTQRTREFGIRMALGAQYVDVLHLVLRPGMALSLVGVLLGLIGSVALTRLMASLLFGVSPTDPSTFALVAVLLTGVALTACYLPARRATKVDPMVALRDE